MRHDTQPFKLNGPTSKVQRPSIIFFLHFEDLNALSQLLSITVEALNMLICRCEVVDASLNSLSPFGIRHSAFGLCFINFFVVSHEMDFDNPHSAFL